MRLEYAASPVQTERMLTTPGTTHDAVIRHKIPMVTPEQGPEVVGTGLISTKETPMSI